MSIYDVEVLFRITLDNTLLFDKITNMACTTFCTTPQTCQNPRILVNDASRKLRKKRVDIVTISQLSVIFFQRIKTMVNEEPF